jgi:hypothetical protein
MNQRFTLIGFPKERLEALHLGVRKPNPAN